MEKITIKENVNQKDGLETGYNMGNHVGTNRLGSVHKSSRPKVQA